MKKTRQEFIVTLDGFEDSKRKSSSSTGGDPTYNNNDNNEQQSSRSRRRSDRNSTNNSNNRTQSDEEFERILDKKEDEERNQRQHHHDLHQRVDYEDQQRSQRSSRRTSSHNHHSRSHHHHQQRHRSGGSGGVGGRNSNRYAPRSRSPPSGDDVDREIIMAEQRLKAQKLLQKSLDQVQSLNTENFVMVPPKKPTAFVNPHFKPKVDLPVMNVLPLNVAGKPLATVAGSAATNRLPVNAVQPVGGAQIHLPGATPVLLPHRPLQSKVILSPMMVSPPAMVGANSNNASRFILQNNGTANSTKTDNEGKNIIILV